MPDQKHHQRSVTFDKKEVVQKNQISFKEARRLKGPIYEALKRELYEGGCPIAANHFQCIVLKEATFVARGTIIHQFSDAEHRPLLLALFENVKKAEQAAQLKHCGGLPATFRLLYQALNLLEPVRFTFDWVLDDMYEIVAKICEKYEGAVGTSETMARIYYNIGRLRFQMNNIQDAARYLEKSLNLSRDQNWLLDTDSNNSSKVTLSQAAAKKYTKTLLKWSQQMLAKDPDESIALAQKAILIIASAGIAAHKMLYYRANLVNANALAENNQFERALKFYEKIRRSIADEEDCDDEEKLRFAIELYLQLASCYSNLNNQHHAAWSTLRIALSLSRKHGYKDMEAKTLLNIGKLFAKMPSLGAIAKQAYASAKKLFVELNDNYSKTKTGYLLAKLQADTMFPFFLDLLKCGHQQYCCVYNLRRWKNQNIPFWQDFVKDDIKMQADPIYCLLEREWENVKNWQSFE